MSDQHPPEARRSAKAADVERWLRTRPKLTELAAAFPHEWETVQRELAEVALRARNDDNALQRYLAQLSRPSPGPRSRADQQRVLSERIRRHMAAAAVRNAQLQAASGVSRGRVRFNLGNGWVAQKLLFRRGLERKPVSMFWFRLLWPLLWQRRLLMPLVEPKGIYCFYSRRFVRRVAAFIGDRRALEIGAGDGTLARFLRAEGVDLLATDDFSWSHGVTYPEDVRRVPAKEALARYRPQAVICSWPPPGNDFERHIFRTSSVEMYVMIGSRDRYAAGNWGEYDRQTAFAMEEDPPLSRLVLPPELDPAVLVFRRRR